jgi:hypothetical protein
MRKEIFEEDPVFVDPTDEQRAEFFLDYLKVVFRDKNALVTTRVHDVDSQINENILVYALIQGQKTGQIEFHWHEGRWTEPRIALQKNEKGGVIHIHFSKHLYYVLEDGLALLMPLDNLAYEDNPEAKLTGHIRDLQNGKADYQINPLGFATTKILQNMLAKVYGMWRELP